MHIGLFTDGLSSCSLEDMLSTCKELGIQGVELGCGNWSSAPHIPVDLLLEDDAAVSDYLETFRKAGVRIDALNCSGNILHPVEGKEHLETAKKTFRLAKRLGVSTVVMTSGLPAGGPNDVRPNWVTTHWPPENYEILDYQWNSVAIPTWKALIPEIRSAGVRIAFELHPTCLVYNLQTYERLCDGVGDCRDVLGINMDPSHLMWMGGDGRELIHRAPETIFHVHLKDVVTHDNPCAVNGKLDYKPGADMDARSWSFDVPGQGHGGAWWSSFLDELKQAGYDGILSVELEDYSGRPKEPLAKAAEFMSHLI